MTDTRVLSRIDTYQCVCWGQGRTFPVTVTVITDPDNGTEPSVTFIERAAAANCRKDYGLASDVPLVLVRVTKIHSS